MMANEKRGWVSTWMAILGQQRSGRTAYKTQSWGRAYLLIGWKGDNKYRALVAENLKRYTREWDYAVDLLQYHFYVPWDGPSLADDNEGLLVRVVRVNVTDGCAGELERKLSVAARQIIACNWVLVWPVSSDGWWLWWLCPRDCRHSVTQSRAPSHHATHSPEPDKADRQWLY